VGIRTQVASEGTFWAVALAALRSPYGHFAAVAKAIAAPESRRSIDCLVLNSTSFQLLEPKFEFFATLS
jgi:uncharacterized protein (DUF1800 family)